MPVSGAMVVSVRIVKAKVAPPPAVSETVMKPP
jgi:hypothetical protein